MSERQDGGPAFPVETYVDGQGIQTSPASAWDTGMSLRDYFAAKAMAAIISGSAFPQISTLAAKADVDAGEFLATAAYEYADAMLKARKE